MNSTSKFQFILKLNEKHFKPYFQKLKYWLWRFFSDWILVWKCRTEIVEYLFSSHTQSKNDE
jgi:hypothetical protein